MPVVLFIVAAERIVCITTILFAHFMTLAQRTHNAQNKSPLARVWKVKVVTRLCGRASLYFSSSSNPPMTHDKQGDAAPAQSFARKAALGHSNGHGGIYFRIPCSC